MNVLHRIRRSSGTLARVNAALFVLVWLSFVATPCVMAMQADHPEPPHECSHCLPEPCHDVAPQDCDTPDTLDSPRISDKTNPLDLLVLRPTLNTIEPSTQPATVSPRALPPARAGPRAHLIHVKFNE